MPDIWSGSQSVRHCCSCVYTCRQTQLRCSHSTGQPLLASHRRPFARLCSHTALQTRGKTTHKINNKITLSNLSAAFPFADSDMVGHFYPLGTVSSAEMPTLFLDITSR